ncbi:MAG: PAS domain-containing sensor histidine kinase, partial [Methanoregula sp.]
LAVVTDVAIPMVVFNVIGMFIFAIVVHRSIDDQGTQKRVQMLELEVESRRNLLTIINTIAYPVYVLDQDHRFTVVNDSLCRFFSRSRDEIIGRTMGAFFSEDDSAFHWDMTEDVIRRHAIRDDEVTITRPGGQVSTIVTTSSLYTDVSGQVFMVGVIQDITERKKMEQALAESEAWYRILFEHTGAATHILTGDGIIDQTNSEFSRLTGYSREEIEGKMSMADITHPDDLAMVKKYHLGRRIDPASVPTAYTNRILDRNGVVKTLHVVVAVIPGTTKSIVSFVDISEQKRTEAALTVVNRKLNLLSSITRHDIINQILVLKGFLELLKSKTDDPTLLKYANQSTRAAGNIEHQITFTRDYQDMGVKAPSWYNVRSTIIEAKGALAVENIIIDIDCADLEVFVDPLFEKVFYNLIDNSLKYGGEQLRTIRISSEVKDESMVITCQDDGMGIADEDGVHLFERGFGKHTGFGLFLSREILSITGITIRETGRPGTGARFEITVPKGAWRFAKTNG